MNDFSVNFVGKHTAWHRAPHITFVRRQAHCIFAAYASIKTQSLLQTDEVPGVEGHQISFQKTTFYYTICYYLLLSSRTFVAFPQANIWARKYSSVMLIAMAATL